MNEQLSIFDTMQTEIHIPVCNKEGYIPAQQLIPIRQESWSYFRKDWTLRGGEPYEIFATVVLLPGNRVYCKNWVEYPFMFDFSNWKDAEEMYYKKRAEIVERMIRNNDLQLTKKLDYNIPLEDMWQYADGEFSCEQYARTKLHGYVLKET